MKKLFLTWGIFLWTENNSRRVSLERSVLSLMPEKIIDEIIKLSQTTSLQDKLQPILKNITLILNDSKNFFTTLDLRLLSPLKLNEFVEKNTQLFVQLNKPLKSIRQKIPLSFKYSGELQGNSRNSSFSLGYNEKNVATMISGLFNKKEKPDPSLIKGKKKVSDLVYKISMTYEDLSLAIKKIYCLILFMEYSSEKESILEKITENTIILVKKIEEIREYHGELQVITGSNTTQPIVVFFTDVNSNIQENMQKELDVIQARNDNFIFNFFQKLNDFKESPVDVSKDFSIPVEIKAESDSKKEKKTFQDYFYGKVAFEVYVDEILMTIKQWWKNSDEKKISSLKEVIMEIACSNRRYASSIHQWELQQLKYRLSWACYNNIKKDSMDNDSQLQIVLNLEIELSELRKKLADVMFNGIHSASV